MSIKDGKDYLLLVWKDPKKKRRYIVGELSKNGQFEFAYKHEVDEAIKAGFELLIAFPEITKIYTSDKLFPVFASRLPDPKRKGIEAILEKYGLTEYDSYTLLKRSGARLPIDNFEFIDPIFDIKVGRIVRRFYIAGTGFCLGCKGEDCLKSAKVNLNDNLSLVPEPENKHDKNAVKIINATGDLLGYLPRYYSEGVSKLFGTNNDIVCKVIEINKDTNCLECIEVELTIVKK